MLPSAWPRRSWRAIPAMLPWLMRRIASEAETVVEPAQSRWVAVRLQVPYGAAEAGSHKIRFHIAAATGAAVTEKSVFLMPRP